MTRILSFRGNSLRDAVFVPALALAALSLTACGSDSTATEAPRQETVAVVGDTAAVPVSAAAASDGAARPAGLGDADMTAFTDCLAEQGLKLPEGLGAPGAGAGVRPSLPEGLDPSNLQAAFAACQDKAPAGLPGAAGGGAAPDISAFTTCLRDNGVDIPENATPLQIPRDDPKFAEASAICEPTLPPNFLPGRSAGDARATAPAATQAG